MAEHKVSWAEHEEARRAGKLTDPCGYGCPRLATCDCCAEGDKPCYLADGDPNGAYICEDCLAFHERALDAATEVVLGMPPVSIVVGREEYRDQIREVVAAAVKAYNEFFDDGGGLADG